jgi:hypothetical protein
LFANSPTPPLFVPAPTPPPTSGRLARDVGVSPAISLSMPARLARDVGVSPAISLSIPASSNPAFKKRTRTRTNAMSPAISLSISAGSNPSLSIPDILLTVPSTGETVNCGQLPPQCVDRNGICIFAAQVKDHHLPAQPPGFDTKHTGVFCSQVCGLCGKSAQILFLRKHLISANLSNRRGRFYPKQVRDQQAGCRRHRKRRELSRQREASSYHLSVRRIRIPGGDPGR